MKHQHILVTGNLGYIGPLLVSRLQAKGYRVTGLDCGYYATSTVSKINPPDVQILKDIRDISADDLQGIDGIIHLAGLSNDPLGELNPGLTEEINFQASVKLAELAKQAGIKRFVYASTQSLYGIIPEGTLAEENRPELIGPLTAYAETKWRCECALRDMADDNFVPVFFRPSTVFGAAPNLRVDIVFNSFLGCAYTSGKIEIKSDGTPWRPIIHVWDVCTAFILGLESETEKVHCEAFNVGIQNGNYTVRDIADAAHRLLPDTEVVYTHEHSPDQRSYQVSFDKIYQTFGDAWQPVFDLDSGGAALLTSFMQWQFTERDFRGEACNRIKALQAQLQSGQLDKNLFYS